MGKELLSFVLWYGRSSNWKNEIEEGTVVDADDLMEEVVVAATAMTQERGQIAELTEEERTRLYENIGMGGLKYYLLKVDPKNA